MTPHHPRVDRRQLLLGGGALVLAACAKTSGSTTAASDTPATDAPATTATATIDAPAATAGFNALWVPPTLSGTSFELTLAAASKQFHDGAATTTLGYNGAEFWGPTLIMTKGTDVQFDVVNQLDEETTTHWHGFHIPAEMDGGPHQPIAAGETWSPNFTVMNRASTYWYHPHMHETTESQLTRGAGGFIIVRDEEEAALALPRTYGVDDIPLMLTSRSFDDDNQFVLTETTPYGDELLANGTLHAEVALPAQMVRLRILNGEIERVYRLGFEDGRTFHVIGSDGGLLAAPVPATTLLVSPGERYEVVVDLAGDSVGSAVTMQSFNGGQPFGFPGGEDAGSGQTFGSTLNNTTFDVLRINVAAAVAGGITELPATLAAITYWTAADATNTRTIEITDEGPGTPFTFDNAGYDMDMVAQTVVLDTVEQWSIVNGRTFSHSFHIHDVQFSLVSRSTGEVGEHEKGWKDTVYVFKDETVEFVARFDDFASPDHPFMYHCHMANHEDGGLMGQFLVVES
jgi:bilirubin oxidase